MLKKRIKAILINILVICIVLGLIGLIITIVDKKMPFYLFDVLILLNLMINIIIPSPGFKIFNLKFEGEYSKIKIFIINLIKSLLIILLVNDKLFKIENVNNICSILLLLYFLNFNFLIITKSFSAVILVTVCAFASGLCGLFVYLYRKSQAFTIISMIVQGMLIGLLLPETFPVVTAFLLTFAVILLEQYIFVNCVNCWINVVSLIVVIAWFIGRKYFPEFSRNTIAKKFYQVNGEIKDLYLVLLSEKDYGYLCFNEEEDNINDKVDFKTMVVLAIATSIDALAVGVTFSFLNVNIVLAVSLIAIITFVISCFGVKLGNVFGDKYEKKAEITGGIVLILIGLKILLEHLGLLVL